MNYYLNGFNVGAKLMYGTQLVDDEIGSVADVKAQMLPQVLSKVGAKVV